MPWTSSCAKERKKERKEEKGERRRIIIIIITIRNGAKTISLPNVVWCLGDLIKLQTEKHAIIT